MAKTDNLTDFVTDIADTIREVEESTDPINPQDFSDKIRAIAENGSGGAYSEDNGDGTQTLVVTKAAGGSSKPKYLHTITLFTINPDNGFQYSLNCQFLNDIETAFSSYSDFFSYIIKGTHSYLVTGSIVDTTNKGIYTPRNLYVNAEPEFSINYTGASFSIVNNNIEMTYGANSLRFGPLFMGIFSDIVEEI